MNRLARLRAIRAIELKLGLRAVAEAERRVSQIDAMRHRLANLSAALPPGDTLPATQAAAASRTRLGDAGAQLDAARPEARAARDAAASDAARLRVRVDVVDRVLAERARAARA